MGADTLLMKALTCDRASDANLSGARHSRSSFDVTGTYTVCGGQFVGNESMRFLRKRTLCQGNLYHTDITVTCIIDIWNNSPQVVAITNTL
jgi:hypothetical protein